MCINKIDEYIVYIKSILAKLVPCEKTDGVELDVANLTKIMEESIEKCDNEIFSACVYNAVATIKSAPRGCSVRQLVQSLEDAAEDLELMKEYL